MEDWVTTKTLKAKDPDVSLREIGRSRSHINYYNTFIMPFFFKKLLTFLNNIIYFLRVNFYRGEVFRGGARCYRIILATLTFLSLQDLHAVPPVQQHTVRKVGS